MLPTVEPSVFIEEILDGPPRQVIFRNVETKERWAQIGECNRCGLCEIGSVHEEELVWDPNKRRGEPYSCLDPYYGARPEITTRPGLKEDSRVMAAGLGLANECTYDLMWLAPVP